MVKKKRGQVVVEWVSDPGKKVSGQWHVHTPFWEVYPTDRELKDMIAAASEAVAERDVSEAWYAGDDLGCLRCGASAEDPGQLDQCPSCGFAGGASVGSGGVSQ